MDAGTCPTTFRSLCPQLSAGTLSVLDGIGFDCTTPVQAAAIPLFLKNKDVAVEAVTGSGKTLAFVIPIVEMLGRLEEPLKKHQVGAVVVSPTRELANQIFSVAEQFLSPSTGLRAMLLVGGGVVAEDVARFKIEGANVLIGTPGRINDVMERSLTMVLKRLEVLVLDEADRLLDMGFQHQVTAIIARLPKQRRTGLFSATQTQAVADLARAGMRNPVRVEVRVSAAATGSGGSKASGGAATQAGSGEGAHTTSTPRSLHLEFIICECEDKLPHLLHFLADHGRCSKTIVYFLTCACVDFWDSALPKLRALRGVAITALHGKMKQAARERALAAFAAAPAGVLLCTDVAARGLDIPGVDWIVQFDPPQDPNAFVHRVGRTARMGREGRALLFLLPKEDAYVEFLRLRRIPLEEGKRVEGLPPVTAELRRIAHGDRAVMEKGTRAFVSFVRGYKEHQCRYIFRVRQLPLGRLAMAFGLLQLPSMPELRRGRFSTDGFKAPEDMDMAAIRYKDKAREKQRQRNLALQAAEGEAPTAVTEMGPGFIDMKPAFPDVRSGPSKPGGGISGLSAKVGTRRKSKVRGGGNSSEDDEELEHDYRMLRKLKKGKMSEEEFEREVEGRGAEEAGAEGASEQESGDDERDQGGDGNGGVQQGNSEPHGDQGALGDGVGNQRSDGEGEQGVGMDGDGARNPRTPISMPVGDSDDANAAGLASRSLDNMKGGQDQWVGEPRMSVRSEFPKRRLVGKKAGGRGGYKGRNFKPWLQAIGSKVNKRLKSSQSKKSKVH